MHIRVAVPAAILCQIVHVLHGLAVFANQNQRERDPAYNQRQEEHHARECKQHDAFRSLHRSAMAEFKRIAKLMHQIDK